MNKRFLNLALWMLFSAVLCGTGCSDDVTYPDVDGQEPVATLKTTHIQSGAGHDFTIEGTLTDADGISSIKLECADLNLNKTIDLITIYGEPQKSYELSYKFNILADEIGEQFTVKVTVTDVGGRSTSQDVLVTMDGDFENPKFVKAPGAKAVVLLAEGVTPVYTLNVSISDDRVIDYLDIQIEGLQDYSPLRVSGENTGELKVSRKINLPNELKDYKMTFTAVDKVGKKTVLESVLSVSELQDFEKMYLADTDDLTNDVFGVPMRIEHTDEFEYTARYYNQVEGTKIYFLPQKEAFDPVCFGLNIEDQTKFAYASGKEGVNPIILNEKNVYYKIIFNTKNGTYSSETYSIAEAQDPLPGRIGDKIVPGDKNPTKFELYIGYMSSNPSEVQVFEQDQINPHLFYSKEPIELTAGNKMNFVIHNQQSEGWWDFCSWRCDNSGEPETFKYSAKCTAVNPNWNGEREYGDNWAKPEVMVSGKYKMTFDAHLQRAKLVKE